MQKMTRTRHLIAGICALALATTVAHAAGALTISVQAQADKPGAVAADAVEAVVIDYATRNIVLRGPEGDLVELAVHDPVRRLSEIKRGDIVVVRYTEAVAMEM